MRELYFIILCYCLLISFISVILMAVDKRRATLNKSRISEATLFLFSALGGAAAIYFSMIIFNHKIQKNKFVFLIPLIFAAHIYILIKFCILIY